MVTITMNKILLINAFAVKTSQLIMITSNVFPIIAVMLTFNLIPIDGQVWNDRTMEVNINLINLKLRQCRSPIDIKQVLVWSGSQNFGDINVCIYKALIGIKVPIDAGTNIHISLSKNAPQYPCAAVTSPHFSKDDIFMIIQTSKDATPSVFDSDKCKVTTDAAPGGHEVDVISQVNGNDNAIGPRGSDINVTEPTKETTKLNWILMGPICGFIVLVIFSVTILAVYCQRKKKEQNKRQTCEDIYFNSSSIRSKVSLRSWRSE